LIVIRGEARESLNLRVPPGLKRQVEEWARQAGVSVNAAATLLLAEGLRADRRRG